MIKVYLNIVGIEKFTRCDKKLTFEFQKNSERKEIRSLKFVVEFPHSSHSACRRNFSFCSKIGEAKAKFEMIAIDFFHKFSSVLI